MIEQSEVRQTADHPAGTSKIVAVVSGKGGSGKTMIAVSLAHGMALSGKKVILFDADFATGGLTYYLTFREFNNVRIGLSDIINDPSGRPPLIKWAVTGSSEDIFQDWIKNVRLVSIGDQRRIGDDIDGEFSKILQDVLEEARSIADIVIVDCRGGIDKQSVAICRVVDEIIIVAETDATSIRTSQHLSDVLSLEMLKNKIAGYILNKVMDNPTSIAKTVSSLLGIKYLGSIPFDIEATRAYIQGRIPDENTLFARQIFAVLPSIFHDSSEYSRIRKLSPEEFGSVTLRSPEIKFGGIAIFAVSVYISLLFITLGLSNRNFNDAWLFDLFMVGISNILLMASLSDSIKQRLGSIFQRYIDIINRLLGIRRAKNRF